MKSINQSRLSGHLSRALTARQVDLLLSWLMFALVATGLFSWYLSDRFNGWATSAHGIVGFALVMLIPAKVRGSVQVGFVRRRRTRWLSVLFGVLVVAVVVLGFAHSSGLWFGVGHWSALWTHTLLAFMVLPLLLWHLWSRPSRPGFLAVSELDRRAFLRAGSSVFLAAGLYLLQRPVSLALGLAGGRRRHTGSYEVASYDPGAMPAVIWLNDKRPSNTDAKFWSMKIGGELVAVEDLIERARPLVAILDCTGGWWSEQSWDVVPLSEIMTVTDEASIIVRSATGFARRFTTADIEQFYLAVGYGGQPLRSGHGAPVRLVVPGRRGVEWVKWVSEIEADAKPAWFQSPLPLN